MLKQGCGGHNPTGVVLENGGPGGITPLGLCFLRRGLYPSFGGGPNVGVANQSGVMPRGGVGWGITQGGLCLL